MKRRNGPAYVVVLVLLGACAPVAERPPEESMPHVLQTVRSPYAAAICIARNARRTAGWTAEERTVGTSSTEVIVRSADGGMLARARVDDNGTFSKTSVHVSPAVRSDHEAFARGLVHDC